ncbi:hypothetical protein F5884DRAFT_68903 [Xylogone sp. PMI_703]|nr:hypothetical protein F5884DRAFT_68903 [Xylogone sp. PMI_703]
MPPPPVTPSPHRFLIKKPPIVQKDHIAPEHTGTPEHNASQFNATPRFRFSSTPHTTSSQNLPVSTPAPARYLAPAKPVAEPEDPIDSFIDENEDNPHDLEADQPPYDFENGSDGDLTSHFIDEPGPKRRRISLSPDGIDTDDIATNRSDEDHESVTSSISDLPPPPSSRLHASVKALRFPNAIPKLTSSPNTEPTSTSAFHKVPRFRPPDHLQDGQRNHDPLPDQFSPHRKGQKYIPGGLAAGVRDWLVNIDSTVSSHSLRRVNGDIWARKLVVEEINGNTSTGMTLVKGQNEQPSGEETISKLILAGEGSHTGIQKAPEVKVGSVVGIKGPAWEILLEEELWCVAVDWKVIS